MRPVAVMLCAAALVTPALAQAQVAVNKGKYDTAQSWALELRLGPYYPDIDDELTGPLADRPHHRTFGNKKRLLFAAELDYQFFGLFGTAAVGVSAGYVKESAKAFVENSPTPERSGDSTSLVLVPMAVQLVYRFDVAAQRWSIPLVPYVKAGVTWTLWTIRDGNSNVATVGGNKGRGLTRGWIGAVGLALQLDFLDGSAQRALDSDVGVNHTYVFVEGLKHEANGLGQDNALRVGDTTWSAGLMFEF